MASGTELATAYIQIVPSADGISGKISEALGGEASKAGDDAGDKAGSSFVSKIAKVIGGGATAVAAAAGTMVGSVIAGTKELAAYGDNIDKMSQKMGISATAYQEWDAILQHSGTSIEAMKPAFKNLANLAVSNAEAFEALGMSQEEVASMSSEDLFAATIRSLQNMEEGSERTALATQLLGKAGMELGPLLNTSAEDTEAMRQAVNDLGGVLSDQAVKDAAAFQDALQDMNTAMTGMKNQLMADFLPSFTTIMDGLTQIFSGDSGEGVQLVREGMEAIGQGIMDAIPQIFESGTQIVLTLLDLLIGALPDFLDTGIEVIGSLIGGISANMPAIISKIAEVAVNLISTLISRLPEFLSMGIQLIGSIISGIWEALPDILSAVGELISDVWDSFTNTDWLSVGKSVIDGIVQGIANFGSSIGETLLGFADSAFKSVKNFFGIASPSKLFRDQIGKFIPEGIAVGIEANTDSVTNAIDDLSAETVSAYDATFSPISGPVAAPIGMDSIINEIRTLGDAIRNMQIVLDTGATVGGLAYAMDAELGAIANYRGRGN